MEEYPRMPGGIDGPSSQVSCFCAASTEGLAAHLSGIRGSVLRASRTRFLVVYDGLQSEDGVSRRRSQLEALVVAAYIRVGRHKSGRASG